MSSRKRRCSLGIPQGASRRYTGGTPVIAYPETYDAVLHTVQPAETPLALARRLRVDINRVLLAYVETAP